MGFREGWHALLGDCPEQHTDTLSSLLLPALLVPTVNGDCPALHTLTPWHTFVQPGPVAYGRALLIRRPRAPGTLVVAAPHGAAAVFARRSHTQ
eukprot:1052019-Alexandrium_andersonii.AAC.1